MPTVIDALIVTLGLDSSKFKSGNKDVTDEMNKQKKAADKLANDMQDAGRRAAGFFTAIRTEVIALAGVSLSLYGIKNFITDMTQNLVKLDVASKALDLTPKQLDGWTGAAEAVGSSAEKITGVIGNFQKLVNDFRGGGDISNNPLTKTLGGIEGVIGKKFDLRTMSGADIVQAIMQDWDKFSKDAQRKVGADIGFDNAIIQSAAEKGPNSFSELKKTFEIQSKSSASLTDDARKLNIQFVQLRRNFAAAGQTLYKAMLPYVEKLPPLLEKIGNWIANNGPAIEGFFTDVSNAISSAVDAVGGWESALQVLLTFVAGAWAIGMISAVAKVAKAFGPLLLAIGAVSSWGKIGSANEEANKEGKSVGQYLVDRMSNNSGSSTGFFGKADEKLKQLYTWWGGASDTNGASNYYDAYGTAPKATGKGAALLGFMSSQFAQLEAKYSLPDGLLRSVATTESGGDQFAVGPKTRHGQAKGLFQFMDATAKGLGLSGSDVFDPAKSADAAARYLRQLLNMTGGNLAEAVGAYNWGIGNVQRKGLGNAPLETQNYIPKVLGGIRLGAGASAMSSGSHGYQQQSGDKTDIHIGQMTVQSNASSIKALGDDVNSATRRNSLVMAYSTGQ